MSTWENKDLVREYITEIYTKGNLDLIDDFLARDVQEHEEFGDQKLAGPAGIKELVTILRNAFPDLKVTIEDEIAEGDLVFMRTSWEGTHQGDFMGIKPTGKKVWFSSMDEVRVQGGKIVEHWGVSDTISLMMQLGAISAPAEYPGAGSLYLDG